MTKYEIAVRLLAEYCDCPSKDGTTVDLPMEWCENHCKYEGDDIGHEETLQCWEKVINDRYEVQNEEDKTEPKTCDDAVSRKYLLEEYDRQHKGEPGGARRIIENAPSVTPKPKTGKWIVNYECPVCGELRTKYTETCPCCGTKMSEEAK